MVNSCVCAHALFACLSSNWATTTVRLLGPATSLPHRDGGILLSVFPEDPTRSLPTCSPHCPFCDDVVVGASTPARCRSVVRASASHLVDLGFVSPSRVIPKKFKKWHLQVSCLTLSTKGTV